MLTLRTIESIIPPPPPHFVGDGFRVHNFFPGQIVGGMKRTDPFLLLDYGSPHVFTPTTHRRGVDVHPHRGFETVTFAFKGSVAHRDNSGGGGIIGEGDIQWMTAGSGILHEEYHSEEFAETGGLFHMAQLWVNLPSKHKMTKPSYQAIQNKSIPVYQGQKVKVSVIAGEYEGINGIASTFTDIRMFLVHIDEGGEFDYEFPSSYTAIALNIEGEIGIQDSNFPTHHCALFNNDGEKISMKGITSAKALILIGKPIHEEIVAYGPFVMNTREEIAKAYEDFQSGSFGSL
jgi:redox-sensitive bicupin YhaK (pirin superfamily)